MALAKMPELLEVVITILGALGGGAVIIGLFTKWLGDLWSKRLVLKAKAMLDLELESYKVGLKKSEFVFEREFQAASALGGIVRKVRPQFSSYEMDAEDAGYQVACDFHKIEKLLDRFLSSYSAVLNTEVREKVNEAHHISERGQLHDNPHDMGGEGLDLLQLLTEAEELAIKVFRDQTKS